MKMLPAFAYLLLVLGCNRDSNSDQPVPNSGPFTKIDSLKGNSVPPNANQASAKNLAEARKGFQTKLARQEKANEAVEKPPADQFALIQFDSSVGKLAAYLTPKPKDGKKQPAIIWITGGDCNTIGDVWTKTPPQNDQTGRVFREAGIAMMFPSLRGGNQNPGVKEGFLGEIDDVLSAAEYLRKIDYIDPNRIYLGGHSTGGTVALLAAEMSPKFRGVFSFGPIDHVANYGPEFCPFNSRDRKETDLRDPINWLNGIESPTFVFEGTRDGNLDCLQNMQRSTQNPQVHFYPMNGFDHFTVLQPTSALIAKKILADTGEKSNMAFTPEDLKSVSVPPKKAKR